MENQVIIAQLDLEGFKGQFRTIEANGADVDIFGDNGTGKTTLADAWSWLIFGADSHGRQPGGKGFEILATADGELVGSEASVGAVIRGPDGGYTLRKTYRQQTTRRTGDAEAVVTGNTTDHWIDGVPVKAGDFAAAVAEICPPGRWRMVTDPIYFAEVMAWKDRRRVLLEMAGEITDAALVEAEPPLAPIIAALERRSLEDHRKVLASSKRDLNRSLEAVPVRVDEARRSLPEIDPTAPARGQAADILAAVRAERKALAAELQRIESGGQVAELRREVAEVDAEIREARTAAEQEAATETGRRWAAETAAASKVTALKRCVEDAAARARSLADEADELAGRVSDLEYERREIDGQAYAPTVAEPTACPACGQALPGDQIEAARRKAAEEYNLRKARKLEDIDVRLSGLSSRQEANRGALANAQKELAQSTEKLEAARREAFAANTATTAARRLGTAAAAAVPPDLITRRDAIQARIASLGIDSADEVQALTAKIAEADRGVEVFVRLIADYETIDRAAARVADIKDEGRELARKFEQIEAELALCDLYTRTRARLLEGRQDKLADLFGGVRFRLFRALVNGTLEDRCDVLDENGRPFTGSMSGGERIRAGLKICRGLQKHFGIAPPVWIDNAESVTSLPVLDCQAFRLVVSADDQNLRIETKPEEN